MGATILSFALVSMGIWIAIRGIRSFVVGYRDADDPSASLRIIRGIRGIVVAVATWALAAGLLLDQTWLLVFGTVFLAEELYETGVVELVLRKMGGRDGPPKPPIAGSEPPWGPRDGRRPYTFRSFAAVSPSMARRSASLKPGVLRMWSTDLSCHGIG
jgi:hypothetical protein